MLTLMAGCKKDKPEINNEEILWQQLQNDSMFIKLSNINFISAKEDDLIRLKAGNDSLYKAAIKSVYRAKVDSITNLVNQLKQKYVGFSTEYVTRAQQLRTAQQTPLTSLVPKKKMYNDPWPVVNGSCLQKYQRYSSTLYLLKQVYDLTMSECGDEDTYLAVIYDRLTSHFQPSPGLSNALVNIARDYAGLQNDGGCGPIWDLVQNTYYSYAEFEANFPHIINPINNDMANVFFFIRENCDEADRGFWGGGGGGGGVGGSGSGSGSGQGDTGNTSHNVLASKLNLILEDGDSYYFDNSITALANFNSVYEFQSFLESNKHIANVSIEIPETIITENSKIVSTKFSLVIIGGVQVDIQVNKDINNLWQFHQVTSDSYGATIGWSWTHKPTIGLSHDNNNHFYLTVAGTINYNVVLESIGTIYKQNKKFRIIVNQVTGKITQINIL